MRHWAALSLRRPSPGWPSVATRPTHTLDPCFLRPNRYDVLPLQARIPRSVRTTPESPRSTDGQSGQRGSQVACAKAAPRQEQCSSLPKNRPDAGHRKDFAKHHRTAPLEIQCWQMIRRFFNLLYGSTPAEFESGLTLEESIQRLSKVTRRSVFSTLTREAAVGKVSQDRVSLLRFTPVLGNAFKPTFIGQFRFNTGRSCSPVDSR